MKSTIKSYLDQRAAVDDQFAVAYNNPDKNIDECCSYIISEARRMSSGSSCIAISDAEVFGMAVHYYDESDIEYSAVENVIVESTRIKNEKTKITPDQRRRAIAEIDKRQMSLF